MPVVKPLSCFLVVFHFSPNLFLTQQPKQGKFVNLVIVLIFTFSVPGAAPSNVRANFTSSTSILVEWAEVPKEKRHGIIQYYTVIWKRVQGAGPQETRNVDAPVQQFELTNLAKYTEYSIQVLAATRIGKGPASIPILQRTDEDSK